MDRKTLYIKRCLIDVRKQPRWTDDYHELVNAVRDIVPNHPYGPTICDQLRDMPLFKSFSGGSPARMDGEYCYRLMSVGSLVHFTDERFFRKSKTDIANWNILRRYGGDIRWKPLSWFAAGELTGPRGFTWWTPWELDEDKLLTNAHKIGLPNDFLPDYGAILRCKIEALEPLAIIPTIVHGFDSPVFNATRDEAEPGLGITIDLNPPGLRDGVAEIICHPIAVEEVECKPIAISDTERRLNRVWLTSIMVELEHFYDQQL
ncbi:MAG TPA: hypothetical protein VI636_23460 [Candidatus Angelobacter sp.]